MRTDPDTSPRKVTVFLLPLVLACSDPGTGTSTTGGASATGGAAATGGKPTTGGSASGGVGGSATASGGSVSPGTGGLSGAGQPGLGSGGQSGGMTGQSGGGPSGGTGPSTGGRAGSGAGGQAQPGNGGSGATAGANMAGRGGAGGSAQGGQPGGAGSGGTAGTNTAGRGGASGGGQGGVGGKGTGGGGGSGPSGCTGGKVVHFVYFVEGDQTQNESHRKDIEKQAFAFQDYWFQQLGVTFYLNEPVVDVIKADHPASWYLTNPDGIHGSDDRWYRLGNVKNEVYRKLGISNFDADHRVVNYPTTRTDGRVGGNFGGAWMDGDDMTCIATNGVNYPYDDGSSAHCLGHVAHEFGHVLGLDHEGPMNDCMQFGFYVSPGGAMCNFSAANVSKIKADSDNVGWFNAKPGQTCTAD